MAFEELSPDELSTKIAEATEVVKYLSANIQVFESSACRNFRRQVQPLVEHQRKKMFGGVSLKEHQSDLQRKKRSESMRTIQKAEDKRLLANTLLRAERLKRLVQIEDQDGLHHNLILDGCAEDGSAVNSTVLLCDVQKEKEESEAEGNDGKKSSATVSLTTQASTHEKKHQDTSSNSSCSTNSAPELPLRDEEHLHQFRSCYICKRRYSKLHHFYHSLCELCAAHNWQKRMQTCDMTDRVCLVTGGRVKIGFQCCLKLLRCGARVICTSRFPVDAAKRFAIQQDFSVWKDRLFTIGLDLRDLAYLEFFCQHLYKTFPRLDVLINNACQTIRRPRGYYSHMLEDEVRVCKLARLGACDDINLIVSKEEEEEGEGGDLSFSSSERYVVSEEDGKQEHAHGGTAPTGESSKKKQKYVMEGSDIQTLLSLETNLREVYEEVNIDPTRLVTASSGEASQPLLPASPTSTSISTSTSPPLSSSSSSSSRADTLPVLPPLTAAEMSQVPLTEEDRCILVGKGGGEGDHLLPANLRDVNNQQIDLRRKNSWLLRTDEVETPEVAEVFAINSISPFVLISKLKKLLMTGKKNFADDLISNSSPASNRERSRVQDSSRLKTLNEFILESLQRQESCGSGSGSGGRTEDDSWTKSAANHRGTNLAAVVAQNCSFIVNVSSMEGKFYRPKTVFHSHTNMAKAALNMLTRTASVDYQTSNIYMSAVDTGWINDENPLEKASRIAQTSNFCTPLDEVDAAARILDPIFTPLLSSQTEQQDDNEEKGDQMGNDSGLCSPPFGCFLKDYHISEW